MENSRYPLKRSDGSAGNGAASPDWKGEKMKRKPALVVVLLLLSLLVPLSVSGCTDQSTSTNPSQPGSTLAGKTITAFVGSASKPPMDEAARVFENQTGVKIYLTYGGSGTVLSQMELSQTGDLYIPGSPDYLEKANAKKITDPATTRIVAYLVPAICVQPGNPKNIQSLQDLAGPGITVGIGNPATGCVGLYAVEILESNHLLPEVYKNVITQAASCDATATLISLKSVDAILGWSVFHSWNPQNIDAVYLKPEQLPRLAYIPAAISNFSQEKEAAGAFIDFLTSPAGQEIFRKWGYDVTEAEARKYAPNAKIGGDYQLPDGYKALVK
jgi:molybdate transport system substrate-binding protein